MNIRLQSALEFRLSELATILNSSFVDYVVPVKFEASALAEKIRIDSLDLDASRVLLRGNQPVGIALMARRGESARLASMGIVPQVRRQGLGQRMLDQLLDAERQRNTREIVLEVITQNAPALKLYQHAGFKTVGRLVGFTAGHQRGSKNEVQAVEVQEVGRVMIQWAPVSLPWQISGETILQLGPSTLGFRHGDAWAAVTPGLGPQMFLRCVAVHPETRRQGHATRLIRALFACFPNATWTVSSLVPEDLADLFRKVGFDDHPICQQQMVLKLGRKPEAVEVSGKQRSACKSFDLTGDSK